jgi:glycosyltransferase involved in cell wall biosynthesis
MTPTAHGRAAIVIPAYQPTSVLADLVADLSADPARTIIVVDDGSSEDCRPVFSRVAACPNVVVLSHAVNLGKGQALKTAFNHFLLRAPDDAIGIVTADADGQHLAADIRRVVQRFEQSPSTLVLGSRSFEGRVPLRNRLGNVITRAVFRLLIGQSFTDTQTGLRGIPRAFLRELMQLETGRYEFELEMLVRAVERRLRVAELRVETVYGGVARSHFNPLRDSLRIYFVFLRFVGISIMTAGIDFSTFAIVYIGSQNILLATIIARAIAGLFNFAANRTFAFRSRGGVESEAIKYAVLVVALMWVSYGLVTTLVLVLGIGVYVSKMLAEGALFGASFALQNLVVFPLRWRDQSARDVPVRTDWGAYYRRPAIFSRLTRRITTHAIVREAARAAPGGAVASIVELGGGNSLFLRAFRRRFPEAVLTAIDTNALGLRLLRRQFAGDSRVLAINRDVLAPVDDAQGADLVFSVGLIEHFDPERTARAIDGHFAHARPGGLVLITFPTPTWLYRLVRHAAEGVGAWRFPDERPLELDEVAATVSRHGEILRVFVNWPIVLTQAVVVARKHDQRAPASRCLLPDSDGGHVAT